MLNITYLDDCGFLVKTPKAFLVFDYYRDPAHQLVKQLRNNTDLPVIFFVSNKHQHHYNHQIFNLAQQHQRLFVVANDVPGIADTTAPVLTMSAGDRVENLPGEIVVKAYPASETGVAYMVTTNEGLNIFHAGDLSGTYLHESDNISKQQSIRNKFHTIVQRIANDTPEVDVAFFPVSSTELSDPAESARFFVENVSVRNFFPMHFWGANPQACDFTSYNIPDTVKTKFHCLQKPGHELRLGNIQPVEA